MEFFSGHITLREIFLLYWESYLLWRQDEVREVVKENINKILACRTPLLGFHMYKCNGCGKIRLVPHSCKSRFCNSCGKIMTDQWTEERLSDVLRVDYHHLVFTVPWQLLKKAEAKAKAKEDFFSLASAFALAFFKISLDKKRWVDTSGEYLMPEKGLKKRFRHNVISLLIKANDKGQLTMPFIKSKGCFLNLRGVVSVISRLKWYVYIGARLLELEVSIKYIGRYTKRPVIAETRIISCTDKWVVIKFKDYNHGGKIETKKLQLFTFITYLTNHIPEKYFRVIRPYGLFSNRLRGKLLPLTRKIIKQKVSIHPVLKTWRERAKDRDKSDPLICEECNIEMVLYFVCFIYNEYMTRKLGLKYNEVIPSQQFKINTS